MVGLLQLDAEQSHRCRNCDWPNENSCEEKKSRVKRKSNSLVDCPKTQSVRDLPKDIEQLEAAGERVIGEKCTQEPWPNENPQKKTCPAHFITPLELLVEYYAG
jgi:hypothetical protein